MNGYRLYGLDETGEAVFAQDLGEIDLAQLKSFAEGRLGQWPAVEVWQGPLCVIRLRRRPAPAH